jgi:hypothetical protein
LLLRVRRDYLNVRPSEQSQMDRIANAACGMRHKPHNLPHHHPCVISSSQGLCFPYFHPNKITVERFTTTAVLLPSVVVLSAASWDIT